MIKIGYSTKTAEGRIKLQKERLELKMKKQEYEIKKHLLDLKAQYHPMSVAANYAFDAVTNNKEKVAAELSQLTATQKKRRQKRIAQSEGVKGIFYNIFVLLTSFFDSITQKLETDLEEDSEEELEEESETPTKPIETYVIGEDDK